AVSRMGLRADPMQVVGDGLNVVVGVAVKVRAGLALITTAGNHLEQMGNDAGGAKRLAVFVKIDPPRVARPVSEDLKDMPRGVVTPDGGVERDAFLFWGSGLAHQRVRKH